MAGPHLDVVIVAFRSRELLGRCLDSLRAHPPEGGLSVVVVDNASGDGTVEMVRERYPEVDLVAERHNHGFAVATKGVTGHDIGMLQAQQKAQFPEEFMSGKALMI